jgi:hypothetical protein
MGTNGTLIGFSTYHVVFVTTISALLVTISGKEDEQLERLSLSQGSDIQQVCRAPTPAACR